MERALGDVFVGHLELGTIESLWLTHARISGAVLTDGQGREAIRVGPVEVQFAPLELLHQRVLVRSVTIRRPVVEMVVDEKGALNLAALVRPTATSAAEPSRAGTPWTILVDSASVSAGRVQLVTQTSTRELDRIALGGAFRCRAPTSRCARRGSTCSGDQRCAEHAWISTWTAARSMSGPMQFWSPSLFERSRSLRGFRPERTSSSR